MPLEPRGNNKNKNNRSGKKKGNNWGKKYGRGQVFVSDFQGVFTTSVLGVKWNDKVSNLVTNSPDSWGWDALSWKDVTSVMIEHQQTCSICLEECVSPRITQCGHIFCLICLKKLFFFESEKKKVKKEYAQSKPHGWCPLCYKYIEEAQLYLVDVKPKKEIDMRIGSNVNFEVFTRAVNSMCCFEGLHSKELIQGLYPNYTELNTGNMVSHIFYDSDIHLHQLLHQNITQIQISLPTQDAIGTYFSNQALHQINQTMQSTQIKLDPSTIPFMPPSVECINFYVLDPVKNIYLHPFCTQQLSCSEIELQQCLSKAQVIDVEEEIVDEIFRVKYPELSHLGLGTKVKFAEISMQKFVCAEMYERFSEEVGKRKKRRDAKKRKEKVATLKAKKFAEKKEQQYREQALPEYRGQELTSELKQFLSSGGNSVKPADKTKSFSTIVDKNGYFPELGKLKAPSAQIKKQTSGWGPKTAVNQSQAEFPSLSGLTPLRKSARWGKLK